jgi:hypothetical protein
MALDQPARQIARALQVASPAGNGPGTIKGESE